MDQFKSDQESSGIAAHNSNFNIDIENFFNEFSLNEHEAKPANIFDSLEKDWTPADLADYEEMYNDFDVNLLIDKQVAYTDRRPSENDITNLNYIFTVDSANDDEQPDETNVAGEVTFTLESLSENAKSSNKSASNLKNARNSASYSSTKPVASAKSGKNLRNARKPDKNSAFFLRKPCSCAHLLHTSARNEQKYLDIAPFSLKTTQHILVCFMWILKNIEQKILFHIWSRWSFVKLNKILILVDLCANHFEYRSSVWSTLFDEDVAVEQKMYAAPQQAVSNNTNVSSKSMFKKQQQNFNSSASNSKFKNKIEDLIIGMYIFCC